ncbi:hypothetical protein [Streptomyces acidiscabies]|uniref:hypothetical protein n=1 Tax=Streptomyces acidiscabies TaxID=42234 RepID=UPI002FF1588B
MGESMSPAEAVRRALRKARGAGSGGEGADGSGEVLSVGAVMAEWVGAVEGADRVGGEEVGSGRAVEEGAVLEGGSGRSAAVGGERVVGEEVGSGRAGGEGAVLEGGSGRPAAVGGEKVARPGDAARAALREALAARRGGAGREEVGEVGAGEGASRGARGSEGDVASGAGCVWLGRVSLREGRPARVGVRRTLMPVPLVGPWTLSTYPGPPTSLGRR